MKTPLHKLERKLLVGPYLCKVAVMIDDTHMREAIQKTGKRVGSALADPVAKGLVDSAFKKLDQGFGQSVKNDEE